MPELKTEKTDGILIITMDNEPKRNALTNAMLEKLDSVLDAADADSEIKCVIITGAGEKAFSSGHDLAELSPDEAADDAPFSKPRRISKPCIAVVNGAARAGGLVLALACDIRICEPRADFASSAARLGMLPLGSQITRLPALVPAGIAYELLVTARTVSAEEAYRIGLANHVSEHGKAMELARSIAKTIAGNSPIIVRTIKKTFQIMDHEGVEVASNFGQTEGHRLETGPDAREGIKAFLEKRAPQFTT